MANISDSERQVMEVLWENGGWMDIAGVHRKLSEAKKWAYNTVGTFMIRLHEKGFLNCEKRGRSNFYCARITAEEYRRAETEAFLKSVHRGSRKSLIAALCQDEISDEELNRLMEWVEKR